MTPRQDTAQDDAAWAWLCEQYEPATAAEIGAAIGETGRQVGHRLRRLSAAGRVVCVGERPAGGGRLALWVAMDSGAQPVEVG